MLLMLDESAHVKELLQPEVAYARTEKAILAYSTESNFLTYADDCQHS